MGAISEIEIIGWRDDRPQRESTMMVQIIQDQNRFTCVSLSKENIDRIILDTTHIELSELYINRITWIILTPPRHVIDGNISILPSIG